MKSKDEASLKDLTLEAFAWAENNVSQFMRNDQQMNYALLVADSISKGNESRKDIGGRSGQLLIEGETGTGKTLGYLIPAMLHAATSGARVVVSTFTRHLQRQIMKPNGDFELACDIVEAVTGKHLSVARRVGRQAFVDEDRVTMMIDHCAARADFAGEHTLKNLAQWMGSTQSGEIFDWLEQTGMSLPVDVEPDDIALTADSSDAAARFYMANVQNAKDADVVLVTHAMLCLAGKFGWKLLHEEGDARRIGALVIDEADRLPAVAQNLAGNFVSIHSISRLSVDSSALVGVNGDEITAASKKLLDIVSAAYIPGSEKGIVFWQDLNTARRESIYSAICQFVGLSAPMVSLLRNALQGMSDTKSRDTAKSMIASWSEMNEIKQQLSAENDAMSGVALRWSPKREFPSLKTFCLNPARILRGLWSAYSGSDEREGRAAFVDCLVLTSATISTPGNEKSSFDQSIIDFGIWEKDNPCRAMHASFMPRRFGSAQFVFPDPSVPAPFVKNSNESALDDESESVNVEINKDWLSYASSMVRRAGGSGRTLVLVGSYRMTNALAEVLRSNDTDIGDVDVIEHCRGDRIAGLIERMRCSEKSILISPSAWEGVDEPHLFDNVIIAQLPYRSPDDVNSQALLRYLAGKGRIGAEAMRILELNNITFAMRKFKQGFGRGNRAYDDKFTLWVADPRFPASSVFTRDISGKVPARAVRAANMFVAAIPARFRKGIGNPFDEQSSMFLRSGVMLTAEELTEEIA